MIIDLLSISLKNIRKRKLRSWLTLLGILIGVATVISLINLGQGLKSALLGQFSSLSVDSLTFTNVQTGFGPPGSSSIKKINNHDIKIIENVRGVKIVVPRLIRLVKFEYNGISKFNYAASLPNDKEKVDFVYINTKINPEKGRLLNPGERGKILLGNNFLDTDGFNKKIEIGSKVRIEGKEFEVVGILKKTSNFIFNSAIIINEDDLKEILDIDNEYDVVVIRVENSELVQRVSDDIKNKIRKDRKEKEGEEDFNVQTPLQALSTINKIINTVNLVVIGIALISLLVGGVGIANTMYTSVLERTKDIGTMKAIGAKNKDILAIFVIESGLFGLIGGILGVLLGIFIYYVIANIANNYFGIFILNFEISWILVIFSIIFSFFIGVLSGIFPSFQASKLKPADALRA